MDERMITIVELDPVWTVLATLDRVSLGMESEASGMGSVAGGWGVLLARLLSSVRSDVRLVLPPVRGESAEAFRADLAALDLQVHWLPGAPMELPVVMELRTPQGTSSVRQRRAMISREDWSTISDGVRRCLPSASVMTLHGSRTVEGDLEPYAEMMATARRAGVRTLVHAASHVAMVAASGGATATVVPADDLVMMAQLMDVEGFEQPERAMLVAGGVHTMHGSTVMTTVGPHEVGVKSRTGAWRAAPAAGPPAGRTAPADLTTMQLVPVVQRLAQGPITDQDWPSVMAACVVWGLLEASGTVPMGPEDLPDPRVDVYRLL